MRATQRLLDRIIYRQRPLIIWAAAATIITEAVTLYLRFSRGQTAVEFNKSAPLLLQVHHMFCSLPLFAMLPLCWRRPRLRGAIAGIAIGFIVSDLLHHFAILPLLSGTRDGIGRKSAKQFIARAAGARPPLRKPRLRPSP